MIQIFSFNRVKLLLSKYFVERWKSDLRGFLILFAGCAIFAFNQGAAEAAVVIFFVFFSFLHASKIFGIFKDKTHGMDYLLVPANTLEKTVVAIFLAMIYKVVIFFIAAILGAKIGSLIYTLHPLHSSEIVKISDMFNWLPTHGYLLYMAYAWLSIMVFASVFFRKSALLKTILVYFVFATLLSIISTVIVSLWPESANQDTEYMIAFASMFSGSYDSMAFSGFTTYGKVSYFVNNTIILLFGWGMTYLRLREKEA